MKILFGVFDWGLGHATRDIPLIEELLRRKHTVHIISTGRGLALLKRHFGKRCVYFDVPSLAPPYTKTRFFTLNFIRSAPAMIKSLRRSRKLTAPIIAREKYDRVISDARYDVYDKVQNSYMLIHQVRFITFPGGQRIMEAWMAAQHKKYKYVLVPDFEQGDISGELSHGMKIMKNEHIKYIGILSQLKKKKCKKDIDYFFSISGPEPQRTMLEKKILPRLHELKGKIVVTLGQPEKKYHEVKGNTTIYSFLNAKQQEDIMCRCKMIIMRSGYTTIMELYELGIKHALLIPTPGQTEQEYLADLYEERGQFHHVSQHKLNLVRDIAKAKKFSGFKRQAGTKESIKKFIKIIGA